MTESGVDLSKKQEQAVSGTSGVGAGVITEQERELAQFALGEFKKGDYVSCLAYLNKLETIRPKDVKVMHNKVVAEYYRGELKKTELLGKSLNAICGSATITPDTPLDAIDDVEKCVMRYNQAVLLYHAGQYDSALAIINRLFTFVEPMEESLAHKVCLLVIELHIATKRPDAALSIVNYVESQFVSTEAGKLVSGTDKDIGVTGKSSKEQKDQSKESSDLATDAFRIQLLKYKAKIYLMLKQSKLCKKEWKTLVSLNPRMDTAGIFLKANLECVRGNYKKAIKLLNSVTNETLDMKTCGESAAVLYYNNMACIHQARGKPNLAAFYLRKAIEENRRAMESVGARDAESGQPLFTLGSDKHHELMYNLGVSLLHAGQPIRAFDCFTEAAQRLHNSSQLWLRMAECCIQCHKPTNAIDFDIAKRREDLVQRVIGTGNHRKIILASALSKDTRYHAESLSYAIPQPTLEFAMLCLKNALFALPANDEESNSLPISCPVVSTTTSVSMSLSGGLAAAAAAAAAGTTGAGSRGDAGNQDSSPSTQISTVWTQNLELRIAILAASAYVSLCLGDYIVALEHAKSMLAIEKLPGAYKMLANLYAAESLILVDKMNEAIEYLEPRNIQDLNVGITIPTVAEASDKNDVDSLAKTSKSWFPTSLETARAIIKYNLAVAYAIRGEYDKSGEILKQVWLSKGPNCDVPIHVIMLALYIELQLGHADVSRSLVKQHCPQYW